MNKYYVRWRELITHEQSRQHFQFLSVFVIMAFISGFMTAMNFFTGWREALMVATLSFSLLNIINALLEYFGNRKLRRIPRVLFAVEIIVLFTFFVINGQPKGFSTLWAALLPTCGLLLYKGKMGSLISGIQFVILIFLFYIPAGQQLLRFEYTDVFMMRFPVLYAAFFLVGLFFEIVRSYTQQELKSARDRYKQENLRIMRVLTDEYNVVVSVGLESGKMDFCFGKSYVPFIPREGSFYDSVEVFCEKMVSKDSSDRFRDFFSKETVRKNIESESSSMLIFAAAPDGVDHYFQARVVGIPEEPGEDRQFIVAISDADAYVREQQCIQQELRLQRAKAEKASKTKTDFLFNMSNDIRTPMNAIVGFTNTAIKDLEYPEKVRDSLDKVRLSSNMVLSIVNDILDLHRIESGNVNITPVPADMENIFENVRPMMSNLAASKGIGLNFEVSGIRDRYVYADRLRVDRILVNHISNAVKFTEGYGQVAVSCEQVDEGVKPGYGCYRFYVKDNGIGMSEEFQEQMYEAFAREENSTISDVQGTGLGLPLAKKLIELMEGSISCESRQGFGTTFIINLPFRLRAKDSSV